MRRTWIASVVVTMLFQTAFFAVSVNTVHEPATIAALDFSDVIW